MGVDEAAGSALDQFRAGRIRLADGTELVRGGTLDCVWAVAPDPAPASYVVREADGAIREIPIVNLTPHPVVLVRPDTPDQVDDITAWLDPSRPAIPPSGTVAHLVETETRPGHVTFTEDPDVLPQPSWPIQRMYVVSLATALALGRDRGDLLIPYGQVRVGGTVAGCRRLVTASAVSRRR
jgi:hypothetical protein